MPSKIFRRCANGSGAARPSNSRSCNRTASPASTSNASPTPLAEPEAGEHRHGPHDGHLAFLEKLKVSKITRRRAAAEAAQAAGTAARVEPEFMAFAGECDAPDFARGDALLERRGLMQLPKLRFKRGRRGGGRHCGHRRQTDHAGNASSSSAMALISGSIVWAEKSNRSPADSNSFGSGRVPPSFSAPR